MGRTALVIACLLAASVAHAHQGPDAELRGLDARLRQEPDNAELHLDRAALLRRTGELGAAMADLRAAAHLGASRRVHLERALVRKQLGNLRGALADLNRFFAAGAPTHAALVARGEVHEALKLLDQAHADFGAAIRLGATPELVLRRGAIDERRGRLEQARDGYEKALPQLGNALVLRLALIRVERALKRPAAALAVINELLDASPANADWLLLRAEVKLESGDAAGALRDRRRALKELDARIALRPTALALVSRARAHRALGNDGDAIADAKAALGLAPKLEDAKRLHAELVPARTQEKRP